MTDNYFTTSIHLISGQNAPNYLALQQYPSQKVCMLHTSGSRGQVSVLEQVFEEQAPSQEFEIETIEVPPFDTEAVRGKVADILEALENPQEAYINYTAGTKPMSIGAYLAGSEYQVPRLYVDSQYNQMHWSDGSEVSFQVHLTVPQYMKIYGLATEVVSDTQDMYQWEELTEYISRTREKIKQQAHEFSGDHDRANREIGRKFSLFNHAIDVQFNKVPFEGGRFEGLSVELLHINDEGEKWYTLQLKDKTYDAPESEVVSYLAGGWLEEWAWLQLDALDWFDDIRANVKTGYRHDKYGTPDTYTKNEYDILATCNGRLYQFEIKSGAIRQEDLYKISEIRPGRYVQTYLIHERNIPPHLKEKCVDLGIQSLRVHKVDKWKAIIEYDNKLSL